MELKRVKKENEQDYPSFEDYWKNRMKYLSAMALGASLTLGVGMLTSCEQHTTLAGDTPKANAPAGKTGGKPIPSKGTMKEPAEPTTGGGDKEPTKLGGKPVAPTAPKKGGNMAQPKEPKAGSEDPIRLKGDVVKPAPPRKKGKIKAPARPKPSDIPPGARGRMRAPTKADIEAVKRAIEEAKRKAAEKAKNKGAEVRLRGEMVAPKPPVKKETVPAGRDVHMDGFMVMPKPSKKEEKK